MNCSAPKCSERSTSFPRTRSPLHQRGAHDLTDQARSVLRRTRFINQVVFVVFLNLPCCLPSAVNALSTRNP